ncbi:structure-specific endonuclease subunit SLX4 isoform X1 [Anoplophora glabripennis]|uniref:structure-specific endonuclease subunit SLX4 isoform X1 n=1 Tax=Anoplophora glabripennis TaxID=217634 RepID=UPI000C76BFB2|nr:structure-specific endonuclease subunit SLX4 isoform X1 [Anoplophora glabripennis]
MSGAEDPSKDFSTPKPIKVQKKNQNKKSAPLRQSKLKSKLNFSRSKSTVKNSIFKTTQDNFALSDVNPDHLQMAIALSKSTYAAEYPELSKNTEDTIPSFLTPEKIPKGKTTLERYGFKSDKPKLLAEFKRESIEVPKKNKNSKFRFITPTLKTRTMEERESIIAAKISLILSSNKNSCDESTDFQNDELYSDKLKKFVGYSMFTANGFSLYENDKYYIKSLNISPTRSKCGSLLKKWEDIPGREKSPIRGELDKTDKNNINNVSIVSVSSSQSSLKLDATITTISYNLSVKSQVKRDCISPDLFESEDETEYTPQSPNTVDDFSQSLLSPSKKQLKLSQPDSFEEVPKYTTLKTDSLELIEDNSEETSQKSSPLTKNNVNVIKNILEYSDEDTEELYISSLKDKGEFVVNLTQESPSKNATKVLSPEGEKLHLKSPIIENFVVDLTISSDDDSSISFTHKIGGKLNTNETVETILSKESHTKNIENSDMNFEMSPLLLINSGNVIETEEPANFSSAFAEKPTSLPDIEHSRLSKTSFDISFGLDGCNSMLNVTDYVTQILNQNESKIGENRHADSPLTNTPCSNTKPVDSLDNEKYDIEKSNSQGEDKDLISSPESCSQESIIISDEELNYSSINSNNAKNKHFYELSDADEIYGNNENEADLMDIDEVYSVHSALKNKYKNKSVSTPVHNRLSELRGNSPLTKVSLTTAFLEDSFNDILENSNILKELESKSNEKVIVNPSQAEITENKCTPEKVLVASKENITTPENNLIVKTTNVTPLANYDAMNTPGIIKELQKFGLKPLKRQRGVKLLKYLYECTHPLVQPGEIEELSSDEDDEKRITKKRKKCSNIKRCGTSSAEIGGNIRRCDQSDIEIVGDDLLKNENFDELIFERKFSVRFHSCRIPLQIVWHNFLSLNADIKENILLYEPLQLEVLHAMLKEQTGCKFHIQEMHHYSDCSGISEEVQILKIAFYDLYFYCCFKISRNILCIF